LAVPFPFNTAYAGPDLGERRLIRHSFVGGNGSFIFLQRAGTQGPYLLITPGRAPRLGDFHQAARTRPPTSPSSIPSPPPLHRRPRRYREPRRHLAAAPNAA